MQTNFYRQSFQLHTSTDRTRGADSPRSLGAANSCAGVWSPGSKLALQFLPSPCILHHRCAQPANLLQLHSCLGGTRKRGSWGGGVFSVF